jgi:hypothetical protein
MRQRANAFLTDYLLPLLLAGDEAGDEAVVAVVSHGLLLRSLWRVLLTCFPPSDVRIVGDADINAFNPFWVNTGYLELLVRPRPSPLVRDLEMPVLAGYSLQVLGVNSRAHLADLQRTKGGVGSATFDQRQKRIDHFFGQKSR